MSNFDEAAALRDAAESRGLRVRDKLSHPTASRFVIALDHGTDVNRLMVHASPYQISITLDLTDGTSRRLSSEEALEMIRVTREQQ